MTQFSDQIDKARRLGSVPLSRFTIDLSVPTIDKPYSFTGNMLYAWTAPDNVSYVDVKISRVDVNPIRLVQGTGFRSPFDVLYITVPAGQAGIMTLHYSDEEEGLLQLIDNRSTTVANLQSIYDELRGDVTLETIGAEKTVNLIAVSVIAANANRKCCMVQAKSSNTGIIYIGFDNTVTTARWIAELQPGISLTIDDYRGDIYAIGSLAAQLLGWGEW